MLNTQILTSAAATGGGVLLCCVKHFNTETHSIVATVHADFFQDAAVAPPKNSA